MCDVLKQPDVPFDGQNSRTFPASLLPIGLLLLARYHIRDCKNSIVNFLGVSVLAVHVLFHAGVCFGVQVNTQHQELRDVSGVQGVSWDLHNSAVSLRLLQHQRYRAKYAAGTTVHDIWKDGLPNWFGARTVCPVAADFLHARNDHNVHALHDCVHRSDGRTKCWEKYLLSAVPLKLRDGVQVH